jgi:uncharacterized protein YhfF
MDESNPPADALQAACIAANPDLADRPWLPPFRFGSSPEGADELIGLVLAGIKTATSLGMWAAEISGEALPYPGVLSVALDGSGRPRCVIETLEVVVQPFSAVDAAFARDYGEGDRTLEWWQRELWEYYARECVSIGREASPDMPLLCERFRVVCRAAD